MERQIILDTNIWISIFLGKKTLKFLDFVVQHRLILIANNELRNELLDVISRRKFRAVFSAQDIVDAMEFFDSLSTFVNTKKEFFGSPDVDDDFLFDLAFQSKTKIIVSGDKMLLNFITKNVSVISFSEFWKNF